MACQHPYSIFELYHTDIELRLRIEKKPNKNRSNLNSTTIKLVIISIRHPIQLLLQVLSVHRVLSTDRHEMRASRSRCADAKARRFRAHCTAGGGAAKVGAKLKTRK